MNRRLIAALGLPLVVLLAGCGGGSSQTGGPTIQPATPRPAVADTTPSRAAVASNPRIAASRIVGSLPRPASRVVGGTPSQAKSSLSASSAAFGP